MMLFLAIAVSTVGSAQAQTSEWEGNGFVAIGGGGQFSDKEFKAKLSVPKFDEVADFETTHTSGSGGLLDISGGLRIVGNLGFGVAFSLMENQDDIAGTGTVPNPLFFDRPRSVMFAETGLKHREIGVHFSAVYVIPVSERFLISVSGGPNLVSAPSGPSRVLKKSVCGIDTAIPTYYDGSTRSRKEPQRARTR